MKTDEAARSNEPPFEEAHVGNAAGILGDEPLDLSDLLNTVHAIQRDTVGTIVA